MLRIRYMKKTTWYTRAGTLVFWLTVAAFLGFFLFSASDGRISVYEGEHHHNYHLLSGFEYETVADEDSPIGIRKVYTLVQQDEYGWDDCLFIYFSHHNMEVYCDGEQVYGLAVDGSTHSGSNVGSNWCAIHLGQRPAGTEITIVMTPLFEAAVGKDPTFYFGAHYAIAMDVLRSEFPLMVFSALCFFLGLVLVAVSLYFHFAMNTPSSSMMYLGLFSFFLGSWKLTDLAAMPMLMPDHAMALGYISVGSLFLTGLCLMMYFSTLFTEKGRRPMMVMLLIGALTSAVILALQLMGLAEMRQNLIYCHSILVIALISIPVNCGINWIFHRKSCLIRDKRLLMLLLLFAGIVLDLAFFYRNNNSLLSFTIAGFVIYTLIVFTGSVQNATRKAYTDARTGLVNRARWNELMRDDAALADPYGFMMIDLNGLKRANDTLGHEAGDQMIFRLATMLRNTLPRTSTICRWGGDEFAVLLTATDRPKLDQHIAELFATGKKYNAENPELPIHFSLGAALSTEHPGMSGADLFQLADEEMYRNKQQWYSRKNEANNAPLSQKQELHDRMEEFLEQDMFCLMVQPVVDFENGTMINGEALSRLNHSERGLVFPDEFLPVMDEMGLYPSFDRYIFRKVCDWLSRALADGEPVGCISCNFSRATLSQDDLAQDLIDIADSFGVPHSALAVEITEQVAETGVLNLLDNLNRLKAAGFRIVLDDFGSGVTSINDLIHYPLDIVKIDRSMLLKAETKQGAAVYRALSAMAAELGAEVVCEGIETEEQNRFARDAGCRYGQGYLFARPIPQDQFFETMHNRSEVGA